MTGPHKNPVKQLPYIIADVRIPITVPLCTCCTFYQFYACGCPDLGFDEEGNPVLTVYQCPVHFLPDAEQAIYRGMGFEHTPLHLLPQSDRHRILPFPCYEHSREASVPITFMQVQREREQKIERGWDDARAAKKVNEAILAAAPTKRQRETTAPKFAGRGVVWRDWLDQRPRKRKRLETELKRHWKDRRQAAEGGADPWRREEDDVDLDRLDRAGGRFFIRSPWYPFYDTARNYGYHAGAYRIDNPTLRAIWYRNWGPVAMEHIQQNSVTEPGMLHM